MTEIFLKFGQRAQLPFALMLQIALVWVAYSAMSSVRERTGPVRRAHAQLEVLIGHMDDSDQGARHYLTELEKACLRQSGLIAKVGPDYGFGFENMSFADEALFDHAFVTAWQRNDITLRQLRELAINTGESRKFSLISEANLRAALDRFRSSRRKGKQQAPPPISKITLRRKRGERFVVVTVETIASGSIESFGSQPLLQIDIPQSVPRLRSKLISLGVFGPAGDDSFLSELGPLLGDEEILNKTPQVALSELKDRIGSVENLDLPGSLENIPNQLYVLFAGVLIMMVLISVWTSLKSPARLPLESRHRKQEALASDLRSENRLILVIGFVILSFLPAVAALLFACCFHAIEQGPLLVSSIIIAAGLGIHGVRETRDIVAANERRHYEYEASQRARFFVEVDRADSALALSFLGFLRQLSFGAWMSVADKAGDSATKTPFGPLRRSDGVVFVVSRKSLNRQWLRDDMEAVAKLSSSDAGPRLFILMRGDLQLSQIEAVAGPTTLAFLKSDLSKQYVLGLFEVPKRKPASKREKEAAESPRPGETKADRRWALSEIAERFGHLLEQAMGTQPESPGAKGS